MTAPDAATALARLGGSAAVADLDEVCGRAAVRRAVRAGEVVRLARGRYGLPEAPDPRVSAVRLRGTVSHESAAAVHGIPLLVKDSQSHVTVPANRGRVDRRGVVLHWSTLTSDEVHGGVTTPVRTVLDLARSRPFATGLAAADHVLRERLVSPEELRASAAALTGRGCRSAQRVAKHADGRAGSVLESALRAILIEARITGFQPQVEIRDGGFYARVDLAHQGRRIVLEADSFEHHGHRSALARDCRRYTELAIRGWRVLRFAWEHVMFEPEWVVEMIRVALAGR